VRAGQPRLVAGAHVRDAEIHDLVHTLPPPEIVRDDVGGLQVAMDDPLLVRELERGAERREDALHLRRVQRAADRDLLLEAPPFSSSMTRNGSPAGSTS